MTIVPSQDRLSFYILRNPCKTMLGWQGQAFRKEETSNKLHYYRDHVYTVSYPKPFSEHEIVLIEWANLLYFFTLSFNLTACILFLDLQSPAQKYMLFPKEFFFQMIFLIILGVLLNGINVYISIIGKSVLIFLNKCEAQIQDRKCQFIADNPFLGDFPAWLQTLDYYPLLLLHMSCNEAAMCSPSIIKRVFRALGWLVREYGAQVIFSSLLMIAGSDVRRNRWAQSINTWWLCGLCHQHSFDFFSNGCPTWHQI